jgi:hypothetical protein
VSLGERSIAEEVIRFAQHAMNQNWIGRDRLKISFLGYVEAHHPDRMSYDWIAISAHDWPVLARHALRHHRGGHPAYAPCTRREPMRCLTPFGITEVGTLATRN